MLALRPLTLKQTISTTITSTTSATTTTTTTTTIAGIIVVPSGWQCGLRTAVT